MNSINNSILIGIIALGGIVLISVLLINSRSEDDPAALTNQEVASPTLPHDLPGNIPIYPDVTVNSVSDTEGGSGRHITLSLDTAVTVAKINEWYREAANGSEAGQATISQQIKVREY